MAVACALVLALLAGCTGKPPSITRILGRVVYVNDLASGSKRESLGVFLVANDPDGIENLSAFYVIDDNDELFWKVDSGAWITTVADGETWIGASSLVMPGTTSLPAGPYRVILQNVGGDTVEETLTLPSRTRGATAAAYPTAAVEGGQVKITGPYASCEIWTYTPDGAFAGTFPATNGTPVPLRTIATASPALGAGFVFRVYSWDEQAGYGVLTGPYASGTLPPG